MSRIRDAPLAHSWRSSLMLFGAARQGLAGRRVARRAKTTKMAGMAENSDFFMQGFSRLVKVRPPVVGMHKEKEAFPEQSRAGTMALFLCCLMRGCRGRFGFSAPECRMCARSPCRRPRAVRPAGRAFLAAAAATASAPFQAERGHPGDWAALRYLLSRSGCSSVWVFCS